MSGNALTNQALSTRRTLQIAPDIDSRIALESPAQFAIVLDLLFNAPQIFNGVPVAIFDRALQATHQGRINLAFDFLNESVEIEGRRELREIEHPVNFPMPVVDVNGIF